MALKSKKKSKKKNVKVSKTENIFRFFQENKILEQVNVTIMPKKKNSKIQSAYFSVLPNEKSNFYPKKIDRNFLIAYFAHGTSLPYWH